MHMTVLLFKSDGVWVTGCTMCQEIGPRSQPTESAGPGVCGCRKVEKNSGKELLLVSIIGVMPELSRKLLANGRNYRKGRSQFHPVLPPIALFVEIMDMALSAPDGWVPGDAPAWLWVCKSLAVENDPGHTWLAGITANRMWLLW